MSGKTRERMIDDHKISGEIPRRQGDQLGGHPVY